MLTAGANKSGTSFAQVHGMIRELDKDGDGEITLQEFKAATAQNPDLLDAFNKLLGVDAVVGSSGDKLKTGNAELDKDYQAIAANLQEGFEALKRCNSAGMLLPWVKITPMVVALTSGCVRGGLLPAGELAPDEVHRAKAVFENRRSKAVSRFNNLGLQSANRIIATLQYVGTVLSSAHDERRPTCGLLCRSGRYDEHVKFDNDKKKDRIRRRERLKQAGVAAGDGDDASTSSSHVVEEAEVLASPKRRRPPMSASQQAIATSQQEEAAWARRRALSGLKQTEYTPSAASVVVKEHAKAVRKHVEERKADIRAEQVASTYVPVDRVEAAHGG